MEIVDRIEDEKIYVDLVEILSIANAAAKKAKEENARLGIPEIFWKNGQLYYLLPDGEITTDRPDILK